MVNLVRSRRRHPRPFKRIAYHGRNVIQRMFCRMKGRRRTATGYHRLARNCLSAVALVATAYFWLTCMSRQPIFLSAGIIMLSDSLVEVEDSTFEPGKM